MHLFDQVWNRLRETIFANQKRLGIMPNHAKLTPWPKELPEWDSIVRWRRSSSQASGCLRGLPRIHDHRLDDYPGGRRPGQLTTRLSSTSAETTARARKACSTARRTSSPPSMAFLSGEGPVLWYPFWVGQDVPATLRRPGRGDEHAVQWVKQVPSHFGGTAQGCAFRAGHINDLAASAASSITFIDIVPDYLEATGIPQPDTVNGISRVHRRGKHDVQWDKLTPTPRPGTRRNISRCWQSRHLYDGGWRPRRR